MPALDRIARLVEQFDWTTKLPFSILTDFEESAVYDSRVRPKGEIEIVEEQR